MSDPTPGAGVQAPDGGGSEHDQDRRPKASKVEMLQREAKVLEILNEHGALDVYTLSELLGLSYSQTVTLVTGMVKAKLLDPSGKQRKKTMYSVNRVQVPAIRVPSERVVELPPLALTDLVSRLHLGAKLEVVGLRQKGDGTCLDLRADGREFQVLLVA